MSDCPEWKPDHNMECLNCDEPIQEHAAMFLSQLLAARRENDVLRGLVALLHRPCHYCGLDDMSRCPSGFPGCALADDLMAGQDETFRSVVVRLQELTKKPT